jgi:hypothetical protein
VGIYCFSLFSSFLFFYGFGGGSGVGKGGVFVVLRIC